MEIKILRVRFLLRVLSVWGFILLAVGLIAEGILRVVPYPGKTTLHHYVDEDLGIWHVPNQLAARYADCYTVEDLSINSLGMRAAELNPAKSQKIAYFGDSMLEGVQVSQDEHFIYQLNALDSVYDHLNFGMSSTGTAAQWVHFLHFSQKIPFKKVYLFVYLANDIRNNSLALEQLANGGNRGYLAHWVKDKAGNYVLDKNYSETSRWQWLKRSHVIQQLNKLRHIMSAAPGGESRLPFELSVFLRNPSEPWREAAAAMNHSSKTLFATCDSQEIDFTLILIPSIYELMNKTELAEMLGEEIGKYDFQQPYQRFRAFLEDEGIPFVDGYKEAKTFIEKNNLTYPYLSFDCDGHFSPLGHQFLRELILNVE